MYPNYNYQPGSGFQYSSNGNGNFICQSYQGQGQVNQGQAQNQFHNIFAHPNQNPNLFQQQRFQYPPSIQQQVIYPNTSPPQQNQNQFYPPMPQYPPLPQQQAYYPPQNSYSTNYNQQSKSTQHYQQNNSQNKPPTQNNSIQIPLELKSSSLTSLYKPYRNPFSISDDNNKASVNIHKNIHQPISVGSFAYIPPPFSFDPKSDNCCSFLKTGRQPCTGKYYVCYTCQQKISEIPNNDTNQSVVVCENCAKKCHAYHALQIINPYFPVYCDCGSGNIAKRMGPNSHSICNCKIIPTNITSCIVYLNNMSNQYPLFYCETCSQQYKNIFIVCNACASICHSGHK